MESTHDYMDGFALTHDNDRGAVQRKTPLCPSEGVGMTNIPEYLVLPIGCFMQSK